MQKPPDIRPGLPLPKSDSEGAADIVFFGGKVDSVRRFLFDSSSPDAIKTEAIGLGSSGFC
jgi:hypothetical protein